MKILLTCGLLGAALLTCLARADVEVVHIDKFHPTAQVCLLPNPVELPQPETCPTVLAAEASFMPLLAASTSRGASGTTRPWVFSCTHWWPG